MIGRRDSTDWSVDIGEIPPRQRRIVKREAELGAATARRGRRPSGRSDMLVGMTTDRIAAPEGAVHPTYDPAPAPAIATSGDLDGRVAIVTGASSGLGQRFARVLAANGALVSVTARRADRLEELRTELGPRVTRDIPRRPTGNWSTRLFGHVNVDLRSTGSGEPEPALGVTK
jgi:hypothetical protein